MPFDNPQYETPVREQAAALLRDARSRIAHRAFWLQGSLSYREQSGAFRLCALGAVSLARFGDPRMITEAETGARDPVVRLAILALSDAAPNKGARFEGLPATHRAFFHEAARVAAHNNDSHSHGEVLKMFDDAITMLEADVPITGHFASASYSGLSSSNVLAGVLAAVCSPQSQGFLVAPFSNELVDA